MKRALKIIGLITLVPVVAVATIPLWLDMNMIREQIQQQAQKATGRTLHMGDLELSLYPYLGFKAGDIRLSNAEGFGTANMAEMDSLGASIALLPLLKGDVQVKEFVLDKPRILLVSREDGSNNWSFGTATEDTPAPAADAAQNKDTTGSDSFKLKGFALNNVRLTDGEVTFVAPDGTHRLRGINVSVALPALDGTATMKGSVIYGDAPAAIEATLTSPAALLAQDDAVSYSLKASYDTAKVDIGGTLWPRNFTRPEISFTRLAAETPDVKAFGTGRINANLTGDKPYISGELVFDEVTLLEAESKSTASAPAVKGQPDKAADFSWSTEPLPLDGLFAANADVRLQITRLTQGNIQVNNIALPLRLNNGRLQVEPFSLEAFGTTFRGNLRLDANGTPTLNIGSNFSGLNLQTVAKALVGDDAPVAGDAAFDLNLQARGRSVAEMVRSLSGPLTFNLERAGLEGVDAMELLQKHAGLYGQALAAHLDNDAIKRLNNRESSLKLTTMANSGILDVRELDFNSPVVALKGNGNINLPQMVMNVRCVPQVVAPIKTHSRTLSTALNTMRAPFFVRGDIFAPDVVIDEKALIQEAVEKSVQGGLQKAIERLDDKGNANPALQEGLKALQGIFGKPKQQ